MKVIVKSKTDSTAVRKDTAHAIISPTKETGIMYKIQFFSSGTRVPLLSDKFKGLRDVGEYQDGTSYKYTAGDFKTMNEANRYRNEMVAKGFKDCFVVKFKDGKRQKN